MPGGDQPVVRNQQWPPEPQLGSKGAQATDRPAPEHQARARLKVERRQHAPLDDPVRGRLRQGTP